MFPASAFWDFSLRLYARPGVADACLRLQDRHGIDVNILFCCLWLGLDGQSATRRDVARMIARVRCLHEQVVKPLRLARTALKRLLASETKELLPAIGALRAAIKKSELESEHLEQIMLAALRPQGTARSRAGVALAEANTKTYLAVLGTRLGNGDHADIAAILTALEPVAKAKLVPSRAVAGRPGEKRPLARTGGGA